MEQLDQSTEEQVPEASADVQPAASEASAQSAAQSEAQVSATMNALLRGGLEAQTAASKSDAATDEDGVEGSDGESTSAEDVKPSDARPGRRGAAAEIERLKAENARLAADLEAVNPPPPDASEEARKAILATESRYRDLNHRPDTDPIFNEGDNWAWLQDQKVKRAVAPELRQHYETVLETERASLQSEAASWRTGVLNTIASQLVSLAALPGIDGDAFKKESSFEIQGRMLYDAGRASMAAENKRLRDELSDAKRDVYGSLPRTLNGGRSSPGRTFSESGFMNDMIRGGR